MIHRILFSILFFALYSGLLISSVLGTEITYNRIEAKNYASRHCSSATYNHKEYKCWNVDLEECRKDNPQNTGRVDCANFDSQALIAGGMDFDCLLGKGKGDKARADRRELVEGSVVLGKSIPS